MLNVFGAELRIGLSKTGITLLHRSGWLRSRINIASEQFSAEEESVSPERLAALIRGILADKNYTNLLTTITLADDWVRMWVVTPPHNIAHPSDCRAAASARFQALYDIPLEEWEMTADWDAQHPFLACAIPNHLSAILKNIAAEYKLTLLEIAPHFIVAWNRWRAELNAASWFGLLHNHVFTIGAIDQKRLRAVRATAITADALHRKNWLPEHLAREALRLNLPMPSAIQVCGRVPAHWVSDRTELFRCTELGRQQPAAAAPLPTGLILAKTGMTA